MARLEKTPPGWMLSLHRLPGRWVGAASSDYCDCHEIATAAWPDGEKACGLAAFPYLWRRFGPPWLGSDDRKELCCYYLGTREQDVVLTASPRGWGCGFGYMVTAEVETAIRKPICEWWQKANAWMKRQGLEPYACLTDTQNHRMKRTVGACRHPDSSRWRTDRGPAGRVGRAIHAAMQELLRPVYIRDVPINILGRGDLDHLAAAEASEWAGLGIPMDAMRRLKAETT